MQNISKALLCAILSLGTTALFSCRSDNGAAELAHHHDHGHESHDHHDHEHDHDHEHEHDGHDEHGEADHDDDAIVIEPDKAALLGITVIEANPADFRETLKVTGELLSSASDTRVISAASSGVVTLAPGMTEGLHVASGATIASISRKGMPGGDDAETSRLDYEAAKREYDRMKPLFDKGVVSARDFNAAKATLDRAEAALTGTKSAPAGTAATSPIAGTISALYVKSGDYVEAGQPIAAVVASTSMRLHADLPRRMRDNFEKIVSAAIVVPETGRTLDLDSLKSRRIPGDPIECTSHPGYLPVLFTFEGDGRLTSGGYVDVYLRLADRHQALTVPLTALSEQQGKWFVYIRLDEDCYEKRPVTRAGSDGTMVEILSGINPGEQVVTEGVTYVKLAESAGIVPEGHSHSH